MTVEEFKTAKAEAFEDDLLALWWDGHGDWEKAHEIAQNLASQGGGRRNAGYWNRRAGRDMARGDSELE